MTMINVITFNKEGRDSFIDFLKAYAIVFVLFGHTFPFLQEVGYGLYGQMQVPIFLLIQVFHTFKTEKSIRIGKIWTRIIRPFLYAQFLIVICIVVCYGADKLLIYKALSWGGYGPGSYYPYIYIQFAFLLPLCRKWFKGKSEISIAIALILICEICEIIFSVLDLPDSIYRLLCIRYLFLIYFGKKWVDKGIIMTKTTWVLSGLSLCLCIYFGYIATDTEPLFYNTGWKFHRWPCYYYVSHLLVYILYVIYSYITKFDFVVNCTRVLSQASYEIFLSQMVLIYLIPSSIASNNVLSFGIWFISIWVLSLTLGVVINKINTIYG